MTSHSAHVIHPENLFKQSPYGVLDSGQRGEDGLHRATSHDNESSPLKIFLVEDSAMLRDRLSEAFTTWGKITMVGHAETEAAADVALRTCEWDVLILDLQLLQGTGLGVLRNLHGHRKPGTAVIVLTNYAIPSYRARSMELGADYFFDKMKDFSKIKTVFDELAEKRQAVAGGREPVLHSSSAA